MKEKAQLSLFFIFGISVLIAILFLNYIKSYEKESSFKKESDISNTASMQPDLAPIKLNIDFCLQETTKEALTYIGLHGGYYNMPNPKVTYFWDDFPYYVYGGKNHTPSLEAIEAQISDFIAEQSPYCIDSINLEGVAIDGKINFIKTSIRNGSVLIHVDYPISVKKANSIKKISNFNYEIPIRLKAVYEVAFKIAQEKLRSGKKLCADCLINLASTNDVFLDVTKYKNDTLIFNIIDNTTRLDESNYVFSFATG